MIRCDKEVFIVVDENESRVSALDVEAFAHRTCFCEGGRNRDGFGSKRFKSDRILYVPCPQYGRSGTKEEWIAESRKEHLSTQRFSYVKQPREPRINRNMWHYNQEQNKTMYL